MRFSSFLFLLLAITITHIVINSNFTRHGELNTSLDLDLIDDHFHRQGTRPESPQSIINQTDVSVTLATYLFSKNPDSNIVFSPLSIHLAMSLLAAGSKGQTLDQLLAFLKTNTTDALNSLYSQYLSPMLADGGPNSGPRLFFANVLWVNKTLSLKPFFKHIVNTVYKAVFKQVDFQNKAVEVANEVNLWAEKQTNGLIKQVITADAIKKDTSLIFANAVYFKGVWSKMFDRPNTKESEFHLLNGNKVQVPFMTNEEAQLLRTYKDFKVLGLPYSQGKDNHRFTMYLLLPNAKDGLQSLVEKIGSTPNFFEHHIPHQKVEVEQFLIPKFKISFGFEASNMLKELGLVLPFGMEDGLTEMVDSDQGLYVSSIHHKSFVEVNEEGTEAAAVTPMVADMSCEENNFVADHPFLFVIREDVTGAVLFMGQVINPLLG